MNHLFESSLYVMPKNQFLL